ncbi:transcriptional regulator [Lentisphaera araneosa HTCC2155]|uniref:Transcriptional regulator n=1 Tax=Lentisphaera araneosa HTCC2155 TaxID=313628 RepID=A6DT29_9BACT|nr:helix-turn-helix transcriptional regulator [Lentisphaera araneosa]EDM25204.1 transcriptional regulator [Lentisphaera araneosa HTCC2155]
MPKDRKAIIEDLQNDLINNRCEIGEAIKTMRKSIGLNQKDFAKLFGLTVNALSLLENDKSNPTLKTLNNIGSKFGFKINFTPK